MKISEWINQLIIEAYNLSVSDIHFQPVNDHANIFFRIKTKLKLQKKIENELYIKIIRYIKFKTKLDISLSKLPQDGSYTLEYKNKTIYMRISTVPLVYGESLVIRIMSDENKADIQSLSYYPNDLIKMYQTIKSQNGLFIFTGPTGSGKSTSMYSILNKLVIEEQKKVITIENPVEVINNNFIQVQINEGLDINYASVLRACLRQDPDIIMIGEIRDENTARSVFRAALTGHTVISTMHTKNKIGVIERFLDFGFLKSEIQSVLIGISNQRLVLNKNDQIKSFYDYVIGDQVEELFTKGETNDIAKEIKLLDQE